MSVKRVAERLIRIWDNLEGDADIVIVRHKQAHMFAEAQAELYDPMRQGVDKYAGMLEQARDRESAIYTKVQIEKDSKSSSTVSCFERFLRA